MSAFGAVRLPFPLNNGSRDDCERSRPEWGSASRRDHRNGENSKSEEPAPLTEIRRWWGTSRRPDGLKVRPALRRQPIPVGTDARTRGFGPFAARIAPRVGHPPLPTRRVRVWTGNLQSLFGRQMVRLPPVTTAGLQQIRRPGATKNGVYEAPWTPSCVRCLPARSRARTRGARVRCDAGTADIVTAHTSDPTLAPAAPLLRAGRLTVPVGFGPCGFRSRREAPVRRSCRTPGTPRPTESAGRRATRRIQWCGGGGRRGSGASRKRRR